jgi:hypothetical protein
VNFAALREIDADKGSELAMLGGKGIVQVEIKAARTDTFTDQVKFP